VDQLFISVLGPFDARLQDHLSLDFESNKVRALLAYLAVESTHPVLRENLSNMFWPDRPDVASSGNLRHILASLRKTIGDYKADPPYMLISRESVQFNPDSHFYLDLAEFDEQVVNGCPLRDTHFAAHGLSGVVLPESSMIDRLEKALQLHRGLFLEGFSLRDCPQFEEWVTLHRGRDQQKLLSTLRHLAHQYILNRDIEQAKVCLNRLLEVEPYDEAAYRQLMHLLVLSGQRNAALSQYEYCKHLLAADLGVNPEWETTQLYNEICVGHSLRPGYLDPIVANSSEISHASYRTPNRFVERKAELDHLNHALEMALAGQGQVIFITGDVGSGKTTLAEAFCHSSMDRHAQLLVANGCGDAYLEAGTPYLPFRGILQMLTGDIETFHLEGVATTEQAQRLWAAFPITFRILMEYGENLIDSILPGDSLTLRANRLRQDSIQWQEQIQKLDKLRMERFQNPFFLSSIQENLADQITRFLRILAKQYPLLLFLEDLHWTDSLSLNLLFNLGRRLAGSRILIIGTYRPEALFQIQNNERHLLSGLVHELQRVYGDILVELNQANGRAFVEAFLDGNPNQLGFSFRQTLFEYTDGNPLFTVELLHGLLERRELYLNENKAWVAKEQLNWDLLPARVRGVIEERIVQLPGDYLALLKAASVLQAGFTAEKLAQMLKINRQEVNRLLSGETNKRFGLIVGERRDQPGDPDSKPFVCYRFRYRLYQTYLSQCLDDLERVHFLKTA
jgi:DNA-binding SARP family transcriptional activator